MKITSLNTRSLHGAAVLVLLLTVTACQVLPLPAGKPPAPPTAAAASPTGAQAVSTGTPAAPPTPAAPLAPVEPAALPPEKPFSPYTALAAAPAGKYAGLDVWLPLDPTRIHNPEIVSGLTEAQMELLGENGFTVLQTGDEQFYQIREEVAIHNGQPYYLTTDSAYHALHLEFDALLKALEREQLRPQMVQLTRVLLEEMTAVRRQFAGAPLEADAAQAEAYLAVALKLFDPRASLPADLQKRIAPQLEQIAQMAGRGKSALFPDFEDDYGAYRPVGHYDGDPELEAYFQGMTWYGRVQFDFSRPGEPAYQPSRAPLLVAAALRRAKIDAAPALETWLSLHEILGFVVGPSDDPGPLELLALMEPVYGAQPALSALADEARWRQFLASTPALPAPQINSTFAASLADLEKTRGWRFMGQRFTLDSAIMQNLLFDRVGTNEKRRETPSGLDVMAALGSPAALSALEDLGETAYHNYPQQMALLQAAVERMPEPEWTARFYTAWLYAFRAQLPAKGSAFPSYMRTAAWQVKDMNSALGSWAELKHDTALYAKAPERAGGGGPPSSGPAPVYVEPQPDVFHRLAYAAGALAAGLEEHGIMIPQDAWFQEGEFGLGRMQLGIRSLGERFTLLAGAAEKELRGEALTEDEMWALQSCMGTIECAVMQSHLYGEAQEMPPVALAAAVSGSGDADVLTAAVGGLDRIYVVIPLRDRFEVAQGGVFDYYEFTVPRSARLTDDAWRLKLAVAPPARPAWLKEISLPGGETTERVAFRAGDTYLVTPAGASLNLRAAPSTQANKLKVLQPGDYVTFLEGPVKEGRYTWWKVRVEPLSEVVGWVVEDPAWYERAYGQ